MLADWLASWGVLASRDAVLSPEEDGDGAMGRPKPVAKEDGFAKPARPKRVISAVPMRIARHSAGGGRPAKKSRLAIVLFLADGWSWVCA